MLRAQLFPVALELLNARAAADVAAPIDNENDCALLIRFAGARAAVRFQIEQARALLDRERGIKRTIVLSDDESLWRELAALPLRESEQLICRIHVAPSLLGAGTRAWAMVACVLSAHRQRSGTQASSFCQNGVRWQRRLGGG